MEPLLRKFYEQQGVWGENVAGEARIPATLSLIPDSLESGLDVGCGEGTFLRSLPEKMFKIGLDISWTALSSLPGANRTLASCHALPFKDNSFDIIFCTEVLEHLTTEEFTSAIKDMTRVAKKYILISVPFCEDLKKKETRCPACGYVYHVYLHRRSFDMDALNKLFPTFKLIEHAFSGPQEKSAHPLIWKIRRKFGRWEWDPKAMCPECGNKNSTPQKRSAVSIITTIVADLTGTRHPKWVSALYKRP